MEEGWKELEEGSDEGRSNGGGIHQMEVRFYGGWIRRTYVRMEAGSDLMGKESSDGGRIREGGI